MTQARLTVTGTKKPRRPDLVAFVNWLPLGIIELKNPADTNAGVWKAYQQLQTYKAEIADLLVFNEALVVSDGMNARVGSLTASPEWLANLVPTGRVTRVHAVQPEQTWR